MNTINYSSNGVSGFNLDPRFGSFRGQGQTIVVLDSGFKLNHIGFDPDYNKDGISDTFIRQDLDFTMGGNRNVQDGNLHGLSTESVASNMAKDAKIIPIQISTVKNLTEGILWSAANKDRYNITVLSLSETDSFNTMATTPTDYLKPLYTAIKVAEDKGITVVSAAGNYFRQYGGVPGVSGIAGLNNVIGVSGVKSNGITDSNEMSPFSQRRSDMIAAPSYMIPVYKNGNITTPGAGTSYATPFVAGSVALLQNVAKTYLHRTLTPSEMKSLIQQTGTEVLNEKNKQINVYNAASLIYKIAVGQAPNTLNGTRMTNDSLTNSTSPTYLPQSYYGGSQFNVLTGRSTLSNNFVDGGGVGPDLLVGSTGVNTYSYTSITQGNDELLNFTPGKDKINISSLLDRIGYTGTNPILDKILTIGTSTSSIGSAVIGIDPDGVGIASSQPLATVVNVNPIAMGSVNSFLF